MKSVIGHLRRAVLLQGDGLGDGRLLELYLTRREEAAFETLLLRHGPMVLGVCRRVLGNAADAEDAFQATFLVLVRKAASIRPRDAVGSWLYGVAYRTALKARAMNAKRRSKEKQAQPAARLTAHAVGDWEELCEHLDAELSRLPEKYRVPIVLCELEGRSRKEVAGLLALPEGTLSWRLAQGRKLLARRLSRHGAALSGAALAALLAGHAAAAGVPRALFAGTARAAVQAADGRALKAGVVSAQVIALTEGVMKTMLLMKLKVVCALAVVLALGAGGVGWSYRAVAAPPTGAGEVARGPRSVQDELEELRLEVAALRKGLESTRQRVKELETEARAKKGDGEANAAEKPREGVRRTRVARVLELTPDGRQIVEIVNADQKTGQITGRIVVARDPLAEIEAALKEVRAHPDDKQAVEKLERAVNRLKDGRRLLRVAPPAGTRQQEQERPR
jgi:RNA polymerase sigma factor (sigma-70 family)